MEILTPRHWTDYELLDSGGHEKLERFGKYVLVRPEPQAVWSKAMPEEEWKNAAHARYERAKGGKSSGGESERGTWTRKPSMPDQWIIGYRYGAMALKFRLGLTAFGHIGVFPEQAVNWEYIFDVLTQRSKLKDQNHNSKTKTDDPFSDAQNPSRVTGHASRVLNLFAYTGGASLAARSAGAEVVHVDSVKPVITWAREMMEVSGLSDIRWVVEDAMSFVRREVKRGNHYDGIILDPPAYGRGPEGEKWLLDDSIDELMALCHRLLCPDRGFLVLSLYSMGYSALIAENLVKSRFGDIDGMQHGEMFVADRAGRNLPLGTFLRFSR